MLIVLKAFLAMEPIHVILVRQLIRYYIFKLLENAIWID